MAVRGSMPLKGCVLTKSALLPQPQAGHSPWRQIRLCGSMPLNGCVLTKSALLPQPQAGLARFPNFCYDVRNHSNPNYWI